MRPIEMGLRRALLALAVVLLIGTAVSVPLLLDSNSPKAPEAAASPTSTPAVSTMPTPSPELNPVSLPALMKKHFNGGGLRVGRVLARNSAYTRYAVTYRSGPWTISGTMHVPAGHGPFPVLVFAHGHRDVRTYVTGEGLVREQDYLARRGYVVLHSDFRNHAQSDDDPNNELNLRLGYTEDVINAVLAVKRSELSYLDRERIGLLGRSMGGGVTLNAAVVRPDLIKAAVVFAPVSSNYIDNFNHWTRSNTSLAARILETHGTPEESPAFWRNISSINFFDRIRSPILIHHGTNDGSCPIAWSERTLRVLKDRGKDATLAVYEGEAHVFGPQWPESMRRTLAFLDRNVKGT